MTPTTSTRPGLAAELGAILRRARGDRTLRGLALAAGVAAPTLVELEQGRGNPTLARVDAVAHDYGTTVTLVDLTTLDELATLIDDLANEPPARRPAGVTPLALRHAAAGIAALTAALANGTTSLDELEAAITANLTP